MYSLFTLFYVVVLQHIVQHTLKEESKSKEVLQSNFDLLAELIKFNRMAYKRFEAVVNTDELVRHIGRKCN